jgi:hypothetical protein
MTKKIKNISIRHMVFALLFLVFAGYVGFQARFLVLGPQVKILTPENGSEVSSSLVSIEGIAKNAAWISLNGRQIFTDRNGFWSEELSVSPGTSILTVKTRDRYGREAEKSVQVVVN